MQTVFLEKDGARDVLLLILFVMNKTISAGWFEYC